MRRSDWSPWIVGTCGLLVVAHSGCGGASNGKNPATQQPAAPGKAPTTAPAAKAIDPLTGDFGAADGAIVKAIASAREKVQAEPKSVEAWGRLAMTFHAHEIVEPAAASYARAMELEPRNAKWPYLAARNLVQSAPDQAVKLFTQAVERTTERPNLPRQRLIELLVEQGQFEVAQEQAREQLAATPGDPWILLSQARIAQQQGDMTHAAVQLQRPLEFDETQRQALQVAAEVARRQGQVEQAEGFRKRLETLNRTPGRTRDDAWMKEVEGLTVGLKSRLKEALELHRRGREDESIAPLENLLRDYPKSEWGWLLLGRAYIRTKRFPDAEQALRKAITLMPPAEADDAWFRLGVALQYQLRYPEAIEAYRKSLESRPENSTAHLNLGTCYQEQNNPPAAIASYRESIRFDPSATSLGARQKLILLLLRTKDPSAVERELAEIDTLAPETPWVQEVRRELTRRKKSP